MPATHQTTILLASREPALLSAVEPVLASIGDSAQIVMSAVVALAAMTGPDAPRLALIDTRLPGADSSDELGRLLAAARAAEASKFPIVLFADTVSEELEEWLAAGAFEDLLPTTLAPDQLRLRLEMVLRAWKREHEIEMLKTAAVRNGRTDRLTGVYTRDAILTTLFRETDRVQRMNTSLCVILFDIDDFGHWNGRLGPAACDDLLVQVTERVGRLLRSYDLLGRVGKDEFLAALPGCSALNAVTLAERMRTEVFGTAFVTAGTAVRLSACFGVAPSHGRSPVVVLREAEEALRLARENGPETIQSAADCPQARPAPVAFLSPDAAEESLGW